MNRRNEFTALELEFTVSEDGFTVSEMSLRFQQVAEFTVSEMSLRFQQVAEFTAVNSRTEFTVFEARTVNSENKVLNVDFDARSDSRCSKVLQKVFFDVSRSLKAFL